MKKIIVVIFVIALAFIGWYFFIKPADFTATIKAKTSIGSINQTIKVWNESLPDNLPIITNGLNELTQIRTFGDSTHIYKWKLETLNDSVTQINLGITDKEHSFSNRLQMPFKNTFFEKRSTEVTQEFYEVIDQHLDVTNVTIDGEATIDSTFYIYTKVRSSQRHKAFGMMRDITYLNNAVARFNIELNGQPFIEITEWDEKNDSLTYNFGFPIIKKDSLPQWKELYYGYRPQQKALKATYNGNYITSDRAWYALIDYAEREKINIEKRPVEVFFNNPNMGYDEAKWRADIYLPLRE